MESTVEEFVTTGVFKLPKPGDVVDVVILDDEGNVSADPFPSDRFTGSIRSDGLTRLPIR